MWFRRGRLRLQRICIGRRRRTHHSRNHTVNLPFYINLFSQPVDKNFHHKSECGLQRKIEHFANDALSVFVMRLRLRLHHDQGHPVLESGAQRGIFVSATSKPASHILGQQVGIPFNQFPMRLATAPIASTRSSTGNQQSNNDAGSYHPARYFQRLLNEKPARVISGGCELRFQCVDAGVDISSLTIELLFEFGFSQEAFHRLSTGAGS